GAGPRGLAHRTGARGAGPDRGRPLQPGDRPRPGALREDREDPCVEHPDEARPGGPHPGRAVGRAARPVGLTPDVRDRPEGSRPVRDSYRRGNVPRTAHPPRAPSRSQCRPRRLAAVTARRAWKVKNLKKAAAVTMVAGGLLAAGTGMASATEGAHADGKAVGSPGVVSGNVIQVPVDVPVNVSGNSVNVIGLLNPAFGNVAVNG